MRFIGIDLGWKSGPSGLCCLEWADGQLQMLDLARQQSIKDILNWVNRWVLPEEPAMIAVDAPTLIPNTTGMRLPDRLTHKYFGRYHAGCYPANLSLAFAQRTVEFGLELESRGFAHAPELVPQQPGRYQIECFPHPAIVYLFNLQRILKYKKGRLSERRLELEKLRNLILENLPILQPSLDLSSSSLPWRPWRGHFAQRGEPPHASVLDLAGSLSSKIPSTGAALKAIEDQLDSLICAYIGAHWWYWGLERNLVLGDRTTGYIVIPHCAQRTNLGS